MSILTSLPNTFLICGDLNAKHRFWNCARRNTAGTILYDNMSNIVVSARQATIPKKEIKFGQITLPSHLKNLIAGRNRWQRYLDNFTCKHIIGTL